MAKLIIKRTSEWNNRFRDIGIYLDDEKIGVIGNGDLKEFEIKPGEHTLKAKLDWCGSETLKLKLSDREQKRIELSGFKLGKFIMPITIIICMVYFAFGDQLNFSSRLFFLIVVPVALYLLYHLTIGRNKYLRWREI